MFKKIFLAVLIILFLSSFWLADFAKGRYFSEIDEDNGKTNFLILGINGSGAGDADLTDTMIFASLNKNTQKAVLLSLPRDIWVNEIQAKINTCYHYGGLPMAGKTVSDILGQEVNYILVLNFESFEKAVDLLGGITIEAKRSFDDYRYPVPGKEKDLCGGDKELACRYEHVSFKEGTQLMDGKTALKYVRSRNAEGDEGTDFARAARQQQFLLGFKQKLLSPEIYLHPEKLIELLRVFQDSTVTNLRVDQYGSLLLLAAKIDWREVKTAALNGNLLINPKNHYSKQWVLVPKSGGWEEVRSFMKETLE